MSNMKKIAIRCTTFKEYRELMHLLYELGYIWECGCTSISISSYLRYFRFKKDTAIFINASDRIVYAHYRFFLRNEVEVISTAKYLKEVYYIMRKR